jgi:hypothetical protein
VVVHDDDANVERLLGLPFIRRRAAQKTPGRRVPVLEKSSGV